MTQRFTALQDNAKNRKMVANLHLKCGGCQKTMDVSHVSYRTDQTAFDGGGDSVQQAGAPLSSQFTPTNVLYVRTVCNNSSCKDPITYNYEKLWDFVADLIGFEA